MSVVNLEEKYLYTSDANLEKSVKYALFTCKMSLRRNKG